MYVLIVVSTVLGVESDEEECKGCQALREELDRVIIEKDYLLHIALNREESHSHVPQDEEVEFKLLRPRKQSWSQKRKEVERKHRVETSPKLSEGEKTFQEALDNASKVSKTV